MVTKDWDSLIEIGTEQNIQPEGLSVTSVEHSLPTWYPDLELELIKKGKDLKAIIQKRQKMHKAFPFKVWKALEFLKTIRLEAFQNKNLFTSENNAVTVRAANNFPLLLALFAGLLVSYYYFV